MPILNLVQVFFNKPPFHFRTSWCSRGRTIRVAARISATMALWAYSSVCRATYTGPCPHIHVEGAWSIAAPPTTGCSMPRPWHATPSFQLCMIWLSETLLWKPRLSFAAPFCGELLKALSATAKPPVPFIYHSRPYALTGTYFYAHFCMRYHKTCFPLNILQFKS